MKRVFSLLVGVVVIYSGHASGYEHPGGLITARQLADTRNQILQGKQPWVAQWKILLERANAGLRETPDAVPYTRIPPFYQNPVDNSAARKILSDDTNAAYATALAYAIGANLSAGQRNRHADKAVEILNDWARTNQGFGGGDGRLVPAVTLTGLVFAAELVYHYPGWKPADRNQFKRWARDVLRDNAVNKTRASNEHKINNWGSWGLMSMLAVDHLLDDETAMRNDIDELRTHIDLAIKPDGSLPHELRRKERGVRYTIFALEPMTAAVEIVRNSGGPNLYKWTPSSGGTVLDALHFAFDHGIADLSKWPTEYKQITLPSPTGRGSELFEAMGVVYGVKRWQDWARPRYQGDTGIAFVMPALVPPRPIGFKPDPRPAPRPTPAPKPPAPKPPAGGEEHQVRVEIDMIDANNWQSFKYRIRNRSKSASVSTVVLRANAANFDTFRASPRYTVTPSAGRNEDGILQRKLTLRYKNGLAPGQADSSPAGDIDGKFTGATVIVRMSDGVSLRGALRNIGDTDDGDPARWVVDLKGENPTPNVAGPRGSDGAAARVELDITDDKGWNSFRYRIVNQSAAHAIESVRFRAPAAIFDRFPGNQRYSVSPSPGANNDGVLKRAVTLTYGSGLAPGQSDQSPMGDIDGAIRGTTVAVSFTDGTTLKGTLVDIGDSDDGDASLWAVDLR